MSEDCVDCLTHLWNCQCAMYDKITPVQEIIQTYVYMREQ